MQEREKLDIKFKRGHSAESSTLLLSALRPRLNVVGIFVIAALSLLVTQNLLAHNTSAASLTIEVPTSISLDITPSQEGTFAKSTASNFSIKTDAPWGYNLTIKGTSADTSLANGSSKLTSITGNLTEDQFKAGASNTWGYLPSKVDGAANTSFRPGPSTSDTTIEKTSTANSSTANNYTITLGAKVDNTIPSGAYTNSFTLTSVANSVGYNITYDLNSGSWSGTSPQTGNTTASTIKLDTNTPTKSNYTFKGWCTSSNITNNNTTSDPVCAGGGTKYSAGGTYNLSNSSNTVTMYAMWQQNVTYRSYTIYYQSNIGSPSNMPSTQTGSAASTDSYRITLQNNTPSMTDYSFKGWCTSSSITNNGVYGSSPSCNGTTYQPNSSYTVSTDGASVYLYAMWQKTTWSSGDNSDNFECTFLGSTGSTSTIKDTRDGKTYSIAKLADGKCWMTQNLNYQGDNTQSQYGAYYSWSNAQDKCPSGWRLPNNNEFNALLSAYGNNSSGQLLKSPANFVLSGGGYSDSFGGAGSYGAWWSSDSSGALFIGGATSGSVGSGYGGYYFSVRCVSSR